MRDDSSPEPPEVLPATVGPCNEAAPQGFGRAVRFDDDRGMKRLLNRALRDLRVGRGRLVTQTSGASRVQRPRSSLRASRPRGRRQRSRSGSRGDPHKPSGDADPDGHSPRAALHGFRPDLEPTERLAAFLRSPRRSRTPTGPTSPTRSRRRDHDAPARRTAVPSRRSRAAGYAKSMRLASTSSDASTRPEGVSDAWRQSEQPSPSDAPSRSCGPRTA